MAVEHFLVIGFGNLLCHDDGVGIAALEELRRRGFERPGVDLIEAGIVGANPLSIMEKYDRAIVVDAAHARNGAAGEIVEAGLEEARFLLRPRVSLHNLDLGTAFELARALEMKLPPVEFVLMRVDDVRPGEGLSGEAESALPEMVAAVARKLEGQADGSSPGRG